MKKITPFLFFILGITLSYGHEIEELEILPDQSKDKGVLLHFEEIESDKIRECYWFQIEILEGKEIIRISQIGLEILVENGGYLFSDVEIERLKNAVWSSRICVSKRKLEKIQLVVTDDLESDYSTGSRTYIIKPHKFLKINNHNKASEGISRSSASRNPSS